MSQIASAPVSQPMVPSYATPAVHRAADFVNVSRGTAFKIGFYAWFGAMTAAFVVFAIAMLVSTLAGLSLLGLGR